MPRRHAPRKGVPPLALSPDGYRCLGDDVPVSAMRLCCPRCWNRLPEALRSALRVPPGASPHDMTGPKFAAARTEAARWLTRDREMAR